MAEDVAALAITVDSSGLKEGTDELRAFETVAKRTGETVEEVRKRFETLAATRNKPSPGNKELEEQTKRLREAQQGLEALRISYNSTYAAQAKLAEATKAYNQAIASGLITHKQAAIELGKIQSSLGLARGAGFAFQQSLSGVQGQLIALSAGAGPVSTFLAGLGPAGIAAGIGLGAAVVGFEKLVKVAEDAGHKARELVNLSQATKLSVDELRGLRKVAAEFGVGGDQIETWLQRAAINIEKAQTGTGELVDALNKIDPVFAKEIQNANSMAEALDILAKAGQSAKAQGKDVALFWRDIFGRGSARADPVFTATALAGGIETLGEKSKELGGVTAAEIELRAKETIALEALDKKQKSLTATILQATTILRIQRESQQLYVGVLEVVAGAINRLQKAQADRAEQAETITRQQDETIRKYSDETRAINEVREAEEARERAAAKTGGRRAREALGISVPSLETSGLDKIAQASELISNSARKAEQSINGVSTATKKQGETAEQAYNNTAKWMGVFSQGLTIQEQADLQIKKLNKDMDAHAHGLTDAAEAASRYQKAIEAINLDTQTKQQSALIAALGELATVEMHVVATEQMIAKARQDGIQLTEQQIESIKKYTKAQQDGTLAMRQQADSLTIEAQSIGMATGAAAGFKALQERLLDDRRKGNIASEATKNAWREEAAAIGTAADAGERARIALDIKRERQALFLTDQDAQIAEKLKGLYPDVATAINSSEAAQLRFNAAIKQAKDISETFFSSWIQGWIDGKSAIDSAKAALQQISRTLIETGAKATTSTLFGNLLGGLGGGVAGGGGGLSTPVGVATAGATTAGAGGLAGLFGGGAGGLAGIFGGVAPFIGPALLGAGIGLSFLSKKSKEEEEATQAAAKAAEDAARKYKEMVDRLTAAEKAFASFEETLEPLSETERKIRDLNDAAAELSASMAALGQDTSAVAMRVNAAMDKIKKSFEKDLIAKINAATGKGFINEISDLIDEVSKLRKDAASLGVSPDLVTNYFTEAARKIIESADLSADAIADLYKQFPELNGIVIAATTNIAKFGKTINDYLNSLMLSNLSPLSPLQQLEQAKKQFGDTLAAAKLGDTAALEKITNIANDLLNSAKSFYASSKGYVDIYDLVTSSLKDLVDLGATSKTATIGSSTVQTGTSGFARGGVVSRIINNYAQGGPILSGAYNVDSVRAMLAGGEYVTKAPSVNASTLPLLEQINKTGAVNDNQRQNFVDLARTITMGLERVERRIMAVEGAYRDGTQATQDTARLIVNRTNRPGEKAA